MPSTSLPYHQPNKGTINEREFQCLLLQATTYRLTYLEMAIYLTAKLTSHTWLCNQKVAPCITLIPLSSMTHPVHEEGILLTFVM